MPKSTTNPAKKTKPADKPPAAPDAADYTLDGLSETLRAPDEKIRAALFDDVDEASLVESGTKVDSDNIIKDVPGFVGMALDVQKDLSDAQRALLMLSPALLPLLVSETLELRRLKADHDASVTEGAGGKAERATVERREMREGIGLRDSIYDALRNARGSRGMAKVDEIVGTAETGEKLAQGMEALAGFVRERLQKGSAAERTRFEVFQIREASAKSLETKAAAVRKASTVTAAPARRITQRRLDLQDGRTLDLIDRVLRAFRAAHRQDRSILVPALRTIGWMFDTGAGRVKKSKPDDAPAIGQGGTGEGKSEG
jgi:hypothetical protein